MADGTIDGTNVIFYCNWMKVGYFDPKMPVPQDGWVGSGHHNVATAQYPLGTIGHQLNETAPGSGAGSLGTFGHSYFLYGQFLHESGTTAAAKLLCVPDAAAYPFRLTDGQTEGIANGSELYGVLLSAMTTLYYGWFFCGGVVPSDLVAAMDGTINTDASVVAGEFTTGALTADEIGLALCDGYTSNEQPIGFAYADDTDN